MGASPIYRSDRQAQMHSDSQNLRQISGLSAQQSRSSPLRETCTQGYKQVCRTPLCWLCLSLRPCLYRYILLFRLSNQLSCSPSRARPKKPALASGSTLCKFGCSYLLAVSRPHALSLQPSVPFKLWIIQPGKSLYQSSDRRFPSFETLYSPMLNTTLTHVCYLDNQFQETDHDLDQRSPCITSSSSDLAVPHKLEN